MQNFIYEYDVSTNEFLGKKKAEADPEETKKRGVFVPLVPAYATLIKPPAFKENQIPVFNNGKWKIEADYRKNFYEVDTELKVQPITSIGDISKDNFLVSKEIGEKIKENKNHFKIDNGQIVEKTEDEIKKEEIEAKEKQFDELFFYTSLGYVKRTVTFQDGDTANFLTDIVPLLEVDTPIITYNKPDFENQETPSQNRNVKVTEIFLTECKKQLLKDFWGNEV